MIRACVCVWVGGLVFRQPVSDEAMDAGCTSSRVRDRFPPLREPPPPSSRGRETAGRPADGSAGLGVRAGPGLSVPADGRP